MTRIMNNIPLSQEVINRYHMIYYLLATQYTRVKEYSRIINLHRTLPLVCPEFGIELASTDQQPRLPPSYPWQFLRFVRLYHGEDFLVAMCNLESMELGQSRLVRWTTISSALPGLTNTTTTKVLPGNKTKASSETAEPDSRQQAVLVQRETRATMCVLAHTLTTPQWQRRHRFNRRHHMW